MEIFGHKFRQVRGAQVAHIDGRTGDTITMPSGSTVTIAGALTTTGTLTLGAGVTITAPSIVGATITGTVTIANGATLTTPIINNPTGTQLSEVVVATNVIAAAESGTTFYLGAAGGFTSTLPVPALGSNFRFIVSVAPTTAYIITTSGGSNVLFGTVAAGGAAAGVNSIDGATQDTINFVANQAAIGDIYAFQSDGTSWFVSGMVKLLAGCTFAVS